MSNYKVTEKKIWITEKVEHPEDDRYDAYIEELDDALDMALEAVKNNLQEKYPDIEVRYER